MTGHGLNLNEAAGGIRLEVKVQPRSAKNMVNGVQEGRLKLKITSPPVEGEANKMLIDYLSRLLALPKKNISIIKGDTSSHKLLEISGITREDLLSKLGLQ